MPGFKCKYCGSHSYIVKPVASSLITNVVGLYCKSCGKWVKWLGKTERKLYEQPVPATPTNATSVTNSCTYCEAKLPDSTEDKSVAKIVLEKVLFAAEGRCAYYGVKEISLEELLEVCREIGSQYGCKVLPEGK